MHNSPERERELIGRARQEACDLAAAQGVCRPAPDSLPGYRIIREIGRGGMGVVYEAEQQQPRRAVALKVVRGAAFADEHRLRLFQREVQTLARLQHPTIAAIYEASQTKDGYPFFAMELVRGVPLTEYAQSNRLPPVRRLELFCRVCAAVNYAHQRGVIHRDLKPSNILVGPEGDPKVLDFGLARLSEADTGVTTGSTLIGDVAGTLPYMSPEQAHGVPDGTDVRSDVYSLGVILYELLTDQLPYDLSGVLPLEGVRIVCEQAPHKPSTIDRTLRGDVETIALKALEKEPARRYQSAAALSEDVERYLSGQAILAHPPSTIYQFRKLVGRHKTPSAFVAILFLVLTGVSIWMSLLYATAEDNLNRALLAEQAGAQATSFLLEDMLALIHEQRAEGAEVTVGQVLDKASNRLKTEFAHQPQVKAAAHETIGKGYRSIGRYDEAELHLREALKVRRGLWGDEHPQVARSLTDLADLHYCKGDYTAAESVYREALAVRRRLGVEYQVDVAKSLQDLAELHHTTGDYELAYSLYQQALATYRQTRAGPLAEARVMNSLANLLRAKGDLVAAEQMHRDVLEIRRKCLGDKHQDVGATEINLAALLREKGNLVQAEQRYRRALEVYREALGSKDRAVASPLYGLGLVLMDQGDPQGAEPLLREALDIRENTRPEGDWLTPQTESVLAECLTALQRFEEAEPLALHSYAAIRDILGEDHHRTQHALNRIIDLYQMSDKPNKAAEYRDLLRPTESTAPKTP